MPCGAETVATIGVVLVKVVIVSDSALSRLQREFGIRMHLNAAVWQVLPSL